MSGGSQNHPDPHRHRRKRGGLLRACASLLIALTLGWLSLPVLHAASAPDPWRPLERRWFDTLGMNEGLPQSIATALAMDRGGMLWIGTMGGLVRYDGYRVQVFELADASAAGLPDTYVRSLLALPDGGLLVGTNDGGLARFDAQSGRFRSYPTGPGGTSDRKIYALSPDGGHGIWIATDHGLDRLDLDSDRIDAITTGSQASPRNFSVYQDRVGNLWLGNSDGLFVRYAGSRDFVRPDHPAGVIDQVLRDGIWAVREDAEGRLWVGSGQMGAVYRGTDGQWHAVPGFSGRAGMARQATVRDLLEVSPNRMWIATDGNGIIAWSPGDAATHIIGHDTSLPSSLPGDTVRALLGHDGNVWAATDLGVARSNATGNVAFSMLPAADPARALGNPNVRSIHVDAGGRIWLGMAAGWIDVIDPVTATVRHLQLTGKQLRRDVQSLAEAPDGSIWVGTQGLARIDPDTLSVRDMLLPELSDSPVLSLLRQGPYMLIGTYNGTYRYDTRNGQLIHYHHVAGQTDSLAGDTVRQIVRVGTSIWYATSNGISIAHDPLQTTGFVNLTQRAGDTTSLPQNLVDSIAVDLHGRVWVGTLGGLAMLPHGDAPPYRFRQFGTDGGLSSNKISAVLPDNDGNLWVSTSNGIFVVDGNDLHIRNLGVRDGQRISSYVYAAAARMPDDTLLFGGLGGLTVIRPSWHAPDAPPAPLRITNALVNGRPLPFGQLPGEHGSLALAAHERSLRVDFALLDYQAPQETTYSYRMEGFDDDWIEVPKGSAPSAIYTNLPHGDYVLHLRAVPRGLHSRTIESTLAISVAPLWYETVWVRLLAIVLLLALIVLLVQLRTVYLRHRAAQLQAQIDAHTRELRAANQRLDLLAGTDELTGVCNRRRFLELAEGVRRNAGALPACIALLDLDRFKQVNDQHGHLAGDAVLRSAAGVICQQLRSGDLVGRYGGEELVLCLPNNAGAQAMTITERIRTSLGNTRVRHEGRTITITVSIGIAELKPDENMTSWLSRADTALYESKHNGRNRCTLAG
ncbi:ligand-binding sensor domain-containing diguanylate cyclase [Rhodanobacter sp. DHG33]|uniref:ligand-binding sensor domain-containing diguanylate cyclase n=1 Tax=Rhodanobacter sp. DHG33 TaxID=2775921 RepID=UPI001783C31A|nr:ligand-binding sensor domain-containing diguanylate cyclase [Rhodanobacter sp. DHG33]MBD8898461.1 diguanylate cyclase [Rhodanobacter sp. DHG33]